ncbi:MAG: PQQ-dependent sugar dehydrogenase [Solirubrobacterales bacterium]
MPPSTTHIARARRALAAAAAAACVTISGSASGAQACAGTCGSAARTQACATTCGSASGAQACAGTCGSASGAQACAGTCGSATRTPAAGKPAPRYSLQRIGRFRNPTYVTSAPGFPGLLFVAERKGKVVVLRDGVRLPRPFLDITRQVTTEAIEQGLVGLAFSPDYARNGRFYVQYVDRAGDLRIDEFTRRTPTFAPTRTRRALLEVPQLDGYTNHNGGQLAFHGRYLYSGIGDGADPGDPFNLAQSLNSLRGKILRIDPRPAPDGRPFRIPRSNPFVGRPGRDPIYSYGLRNPYRFSFQDVPGGPDRIVIADVGQHRFEEIDYTTLAAASGANFGWDAYEGAFLYDPACGALCPNSGTPDPGGTVFPIKQIKHPDFCAVIGGYVMDDPALPALRGRYVYGDYCSGRIRSLAPVPTPPATDDASIGVKLPNGPDGFPALTSMGLDAQKHLYLSSGNGPVYRLVAARGR